MRHIEALLARHPPQMIQRMFSQAIDSRMYFVFLLVVLALTDFRPQLHCLIFHVHQHRQLIRHIFIGIIMAVAVVNRVIFLVFDEQQQQSAFHRVLVFVAIQSEATGASLVPNWT